MRVHSLFTLRSCKALLAGAALMMATVSGAAAQVTGYSQDFEALNAADPGALSGDGWLGFGAVLGKFGFGPFGAPNGGPGFSAVASGEAGPAQGVQYINTYSDYNCCGATDGHSVGETVQATVFQEQNITAADIGKDVTFIFDGKRPSTAAGTALAPPSEGEAFILTLDPNNGFAITNFISFDALTLSQEDWSTHSLTLSLADPLLNGQILQFGFQNRATNFDNTGVFYDNINFVVPEPASFVLLGLGAVALPYRRRARLA
ncbi:MAG: PEP-CTERM sorting domain-containing protein [Planctomycetota bacterium]